ncbi:hypothetical protein RJT34_11867 [Clitoria ternatea]|uniref:Uncharacterized protein n=1 Tax=Clitoria ternatea TaxID=43366 RepID=A0AAN9JNB9_CLITE
MIEVTCRLGRGGTKHTWIMLVSNAPDEERELRGRSNGARSDLTSMKTLRLSISSYGSVVKRNWELMVIERGEWVVG